MINATQIRTGLFLRIEKELFCVLKVNHVTPGKGNAVVQTDLRNLRTGIKINQRFRSTETVEEIELPQAMLGDAVKFLKPEAQITIFRHEGNPVSVSLAARIPFEVKECDPPTKGMAGATKDAVLENGNVVKVPLFIKPGDVIVVDTETNSYLEKG